MQANGFVRWIGELARTHTAQLVAEARGEGLSATDALDAVQTGFHTFLLLPQARSLALDHDDSARLLAVVVRNAARNMRRKHHRARPHETLEETVLADDAPSPDELIAQAEEHVRLLGCINLLGDLQRRVATLRMLEEVSSAAVGAELGLTPAHVAVLLHRAKRELERCLSERFG